MASNVLIGVWASGVWIGLGQPTSLSSLTISGYATQPSTIGQLNDRIGTCFSGSGNSGPGTFDFDVAPDITPSELAIIEQMYMVSYFNNLAIATMGGGVGMLPWTYISEGDSKIGRVNAGTIGKEYREMAKDAFTRLNFLVNTYIQQGQGADIPRQVAYLNPTVPGYAGDGYGPILGNGPG